jgi:hypothetical protein
LQLRVLAAKAGQECGQLQIAERGGGAQTQEAARLFAPVAQLGIQGLGEQRQLIVKYA